MTNPDGQHHLLHRMPRVVQPHEPLGDADGVAPSSEASRTAPGPILPRPADDARAARPVPKAGHLRLASGVGQSKGLVGRAYSRLKRLLVGRPLASHEEPHERVNVFTGLAVFASDNISSSAYATEEIMRVLVLAGVGVLALTLPITIAICVVLGIVVISYQQTISAYPSGGGSYIVASDNLGPLPALVAAAALLTDYVLTVSVSIAAGVAALTSVFPGWFDE